MPNRLRALFISLYLTFVFSFIVCFCFFLPFKLLRFDYALNELCAGQRHLHFTLETVEIKEESDEPAESGNDQNSEQTFEKKC